MKRRVKTRTLENRKGCGTLTNKDKFKIASVNLKGSTRRPSYNGFHMEDST